MPKTLRDARDAMASKQLKPTAQWLKNATKSMGLNTLDILREISPNIYDVSETAMTTASGIYKNLSTGKNGNRRVVNALTRNTYVKMASEGIQTALRDLRTGTFNNEISGGGGNDLGDNTAARTMFEDVGGDEAQANPEINHIAEEGMARISEGVTRQTETILKSTKATIDSMVSISGAQMMQSQQNTNTIVSEMQNINNSLQALVAYNNDNMTKLITSSLAFYEKVGATIAPSKQEEAAKKTSAADLFKKGKFDVKSYFDLVKKQGKEALENSEIGQLKMLADMLGEEVVKNPVKYISQELIKKAIPDALKTAASEVDKTFGEFMPAMLSQLYDKWGADNDGTILGKFKQLVGKTFGLNVDANKGLELGGKITKEAATFDKITRTAIIEEIPKYLRESTAYLKEIAEVLGGNTGKALANSEILDRETGEYKKKSDYDKQMMEEMINSIRGAFGETTFGQYMNNKATGLNNRDAKNYDEALNKFYLALQQRDKNTIDLTDLSEGGDLRGIVDNLDGVSAGMKRYLLSSLKNSYENEAGGMSFAAANLKAKQARNNTLQEISNNTDLKRVLGNVGYQRAFDENGKEIAIDAQISRGLYGNKNASDAALKSNPNELLKDIRFLLDRGINVFQLGSKKDRDEKFQLLFGTRGSGSDSGGSHSTNIEINQEEQSEIDSMSTDAIDRMSAQGDQENDVLQENESDGRVGRAAKNKAKRLRTAMHYLAVGNTTRAYEELGGLFGDTITSITRSIKNDFITPLTNKIFGESPDDENALLYKARKMFGDIKKNTKEFLFGKEDDENSKGVIGTVTDSWKTGMNHWKEVLFGKNDDDDEAVKEQIEKKKKRMLGGALGGAAAGVTAGGILGNLIGGPVTGAILGSAAGYLSTNDRFLDFVFGKKDKDGNRMDDGIISKKTQEWFKDKKNKDAVIGGAGAGLVAGALGGGGLLGSLVGGPFAGAILGAAGGMVVRSKAFQDFIFGERDENGDPKDGGWEGLKTKFDKWKDKHLSDKNGNVMGGKLASMTFTGGGLGFLAGMFTPMGPIGGAAIGMATSMIANKDKFKEFLFGKKDPEGNQLEEGLIGRIGNVLKTDLIRPMKNTIGNLAEDAIDAVKENVLEPISLAFEPVKIMFSRIYDATIGKIKDKLDEAADFIKETLKNTALNVSRLVTNTITAPFKFAGKLIGGLFNKITGTTGGVLKGIATLADNRNQAASRRKWAKDPNRDRYVAQWTEEWNNMSEEDRKTKGGSLSAYIEGQKSHLFYNSHLEEKNARRLENKKKRREDKQARREEQQRLEKQGRLVSRLTGGKYATLTRENADEVMNAYHSSKQYVRGRKLLGMNAAEIEDLLKKPDATVTDNAQVLQNAEEAVEAAESVARDTSGIARFLQDSGENLGDAIGKAIKSLIKAPGKATRKVKQAAIEHKNHLERGALDDVDSSDMAITAHAMASGRFTSGDDARDNEHYLDNIPEEVAHRRSSIWHGGLRSIGENIGWHRDRARNAINSALERRLENEFNLDEGAMSGQVTGGLIGKYRSFARNRNILDADRRGILVDPNDRHYRRGIIGGAFANAWDQGAHERNVLGTLQRAQDTVNVDNAGTTIAEALGGAIENLFGGNGDRVPHFKKGGKLPTRRRRENGPNVSIVGEEGPEVLLSHGEHSVIPNNQLMRVVIESISPEAEKQMKPDNDIQDVNIIGQDNPITMYPLGAKFNEHTDAKQKIEKDLEEEDKLVELQNVKEDIGDPDAEGDVEKDEEPEEKKESLIDKIKKFLAGSALVIGATGVVSWLLNNKDKVTTFITDTIPTFVKDQMPKVVTFVTETLPEKVDEVIEVVKPIATAVETIAGWALSGLGDVATDIKNFLEKHMNTREDGKTVEDKINDVKTELGYLKTGDYDKFIHGVDGKWGPESSARMRLPLLLAGSAVGVNDIKIAGHRVRKGNFKEGVKNIDDLMHPVRTFKNGKLYKSFAKSEFELAGGKFGESIIRGADGNINAISESAYKRIAQANGFTDDAARELFMQRTGLNIVDDTAGKGHKLVEGTKNIARKAGEKISNTNLVKGAKTVATNAKNAVVEGTKNIAENSELLTKLKGVFKEIGEKIAGFVEKRGFKGIGSKVGKITGFLDDILKNIIKLKDTPIVKKGLAKIAKVLGVAAGAAATVVGFVFSEGGQAILGGLKGLGKKGTAQLFRVSEDAVDTPMRIISTALQAFEGTFFGTVLEILAGIAESIFGVNLISELAVLVYSLIMNASGHGEKADSLLNAREAQLDEYKAYQDAEKEKAYQEYLTENNLTEEQFTKEDFEKAIENKEISVSYDSYADWNYKKHKTLKDKVEETVVSGAVKVAGGIKRGVGAVVKGGASLVKGVKDFGKSKKERKAERAAARAEKADKVKSDTEGMSFLEKIMYMDKVGFDAVKDYVLCNSDDIDFGISKDSPFYPVARIAETAIKVPLLTPRLIVKIGKKLGDLFPNVKDAVVDTATGIKNYVTGESDHINPESNEKGFNISTIPNTIVEQSLSPLRLLVKAGKGVINFFKEHGEGIKNFGEATMIASKDYILGKSEMFNLGHHGDKGLGITATVEFIMANMLDPVRSVVLGVKKIKDVFTKLNEAGRKRGQEMRQAEMDYITGKTDILDTTPDTDENAIENAADKVRQFFLKGPRYLYQNMDNIKSFFKGIFDEVKEHSARKDDEKMKYVLGEVDVIDTSYDKEGPLATFYSVTDMLDAIMLLTPRLLVKGFKGIKSGLEKLTGDTRTFDAELTKAEDRYIHGDSDKIEIEIPEDNLFSPAIAAISKIDEILLLVPRKLYKVFGKAKETVDNIKKDIGEKWDAATKGLNDAKDKVKNFFGSIGEEFTGFFDNIDPSTAGGGGFGAKVPHFSQKDPRWASTSYRENGAGNDTLRNAGCGPAAFAMAASAATNRQITPVESANVMQNVGARDNTGTNWGGFNKAARVYGINSRMALNPSEGFVDASLRAGHPVVLSGRTGGYGNNGETPYTKGGHYVVATGIDSMGNYIINDPNKMSGHQRYNKDKMMKETGAAWAFGGRGPYLPDFPGYNSNSTNNIYSYMPEGLQNYMNDRSAMNGDSRYSKQTLTNDGSQFSSSAKKTVLTNDNSQYTGGYVSGINYATDSRFQNTGTDIEKWMAIVKAVKQAVASQGLKYNQQGSADITIDGKTVRMRTDCSGFVTTCLKFYGVIGDNVSLSSRSFLGSGDAALKNSGFTPGGWPGWDGLQEGDIIAKAGHVEIFSRNEGGKHYVYNCGSDGAMAQPGETGSTKSEYTDVWRPGPAGTGCVSGSATAGGVNGGSSAATMAGKSSNGLGGILGVLASWGGELASRLVNGIGSGKFNTDWSSFLSGQSSSNASGGVNGGSSAATVAGDSSNGYSPNATAGLVGDSNAQMVWNYLKDQGFTDEAAAGIMGNLQQESSMDFSKHQMNGGKGRGLCQWSVGERWETLKQFAAEHGGSEWDGKQQLDFMMYELEGGDGATVSILNKRFGGLEGLKQMTDIGRAADAFEQAFERAGEPAMANRYAYANDFYNQFKGTHGSAVLANDNSQFTYNSNVNPSGLRYESGLGGFGGFGEMDPMMTDMSGATVENQTELQKTENYIPKQITPLPTNPANSDYLGKVVEYLETIMGVLTDSNDKIGTINSNLGTSISKLGETVNNGINVNNYNMQNGRNGETVVAPSVRKTTNPGFIKAASIALG